ncbi:hypothetical protein NQ314_002657 [Rhamnusium bicolor]|uniref:PiggyBac transposable element-derived protein domain-containing protein n=1 Tax=Rhamnusium bicolor TaxID=1586634 RepID=A0AAV8ZSD7_9CUCU|nr:hypothetical protein NQ314_002657 [Rhamnusium bicolor]
MAIVLRGFTLQEALEMAYDENIYEIFIEPPDANIVLTDEDSGDEDGGGTLDNLPGSQLRAEAEIILADNTRIGGGSTKTIPNPSDKPLFSKPSTSSQCTELSVPDWIHGDIETPNHKFPEHNHEQYKGLSPTELFEKFFDEQIILLLLQETSKYALFLNCPHPKISVEELKCFIGILILSGYNTLPGKRCYWDSQDDMRNTMVYNEMRRDRFLQIARFLHCADNNAPDVSDKIWKLRPLMDKIKNKYLQHFQPE